MTLKKKATDSVDAKAVAAEKSKDRKKRVPQTDIPGHTIDEALRVAQAINDEYAGAASTPFEIAVAMGIQPTTGRFRALTGASVAYGLTEGAAQADEISLTELGRRIVSPTLEDDDIQAKREATLKPRIMNAFLTKYDKNKLPRDDIAQNVLKQLGVPADSVEKAWKLILKSAQDAGFITEINGVKNVHLKGALPPRPERPIVETDSDPVDEALEKFDDLEVPDENDSEEEIAPPVETQKKRPNAIFVGHGKNKKPRNQLTKILDQYGIPYKVAEDEPNKGRPIPTKVKETMEDCGAAILIFSADEELFDESGDAFWRPSENVVHELGAASVLYGNRIIIFREEVVKLASNFESIGYITFEKDDVTAKANDLFRELIAFDILKVSVND